MTNLNYSTTPNTCFLGVNLPIPMMKSKDIGSQLVSQNYRLVLYRTLTQFTKFQAIFSRAKTKYHHSTQSNGFLALRSVILICMISLFLITKLESSILCFYNLLSFFFISSQTFNLYQILVSATNSLRQTDLAGDWLLNHFICNHHNVLDDISPLKLLPKHKYHLCSINSVGVRSPVQVAQH